MAPLFFLFRLLSAYKFFTRVEDESFTSSPSSSTFPPCLEGAYGYWAGYGATEYSVTIQ